MSSKNKKAKIENSLSGLEDKGEENFQKAGQERPMYLTKRSKKINERTFR